MSSLSSNPIKILFELPLSPTIPISPEGEPDCPFASSINLSVITVFVEEAVVVLPVTSKFPENVTLPVNVCPLSASDLSSAADTALAAICTAVTASVAISLAPTAFAAIWSAAIILAPILLALIALCAISSATIDKLTILADVIPVSYTHLTLPTKRIV